MDRSEKQTKVKLAYFDFSHHAYYMCRVSNSRALALENDSFSVSKCPALRFSFHFLRPPRNELNFGDNSSWAASSWVVILLVIPCEINI